MVFEERHQIGFKVILQTDINLQLIIGSHLRGRKWNVGCPRDEYYDHYNKNDLADGCKYFLPILFADGTDLSGIECEFNKELADISAWLKVNKLPLHINVVALQLWALKPVEFFPFRHFCWIYGAFMLICL